MGSGGGGRCCVANFCCVGNCCVFVKIKEKIFGKSRGSSSGGSTSSYNQNVADLELTVKVQNALTEFREDTRAKSERFEDDIIRECREDLDEFIKELKKYNRIRYGSSMLNIDIGQLERENRKTEDKIHGFIVKRVSKRISLDDTECLEILKLDPGAEKTRRSETEKRANPRRETMRSIPESRSGRTISPSAATPVRVDTSE